VAAPVSLRHVREAVVLVRQGQGRLREHRPLPRVQRELPLLGPPDRPPRADDVPGVRPRLEIIERSRIGFAQPRLVELQLYRPRLVLECVKRQLPEHPPDHDPSRHGVLVLRVLLAGFEFPLVIRREARRGCGGIVRVRVRFDPGVAHRRDLGEARVAQLVDAHLGDVVVLLLLRSPRRRRRRRRGFRRRRSSISLSRGSRRGRRDPPRDYIRELRLERLELLDVGCQIGFAPPPPRVVLGRPPRGGVGG